ncbi:hypothetical protein AB0L97_33080 [Nocardia sp. NPDC051911]|uniref:hypothetical protein n=1 Tax=Nocardia sp. NPDC051911 TaxID=3154648 RepID=UPI00341B2E0C
MNSLDELHALWAADDAAKRALARPGDADQWFDTAEGIVPLGDDGRVDDYIPRGPAHGPKHARRFARLMSSHPAEVNRR